MPRYRIEKFDDPSARAEHLNAVHVFAHIPVALTAISLPDLITRLVQILF